MLNLLTITAATNTLRLDDKRHAEIQFTVFNSSGRQMRARARVVPQNPAAEKWLTLVGEAERDFPIAGAQQYNVQIAPPPDAPAGSYPFRLDMVGVENPDEQLTQGPSVTFEVPAPEPAKKGFPIWIPVAAILALLVIVGVIVAVMLSGDGKAQESANATATALALQDAAATAQAQSTETALANFSYDFITRADTATWRAGPPLGTLPFNSGRSDPGGFVGVLDYYADNTSTYTNPLVIQPAWVANGTTYGCYTDVYVGGNVVRPTDHISGKVGFVELDFDGEPITARISVRAQGLGEQDIVSISLSASTRGLQPFDQPLGTRYEGRPVDICLHVDGGPTASEVEVPWIEVKLTR